jgi:hypothetical protein
VKADDPDGDPVTYSLLASPQGMTIDGASGVVQWKPTLNDAGLHHIEITAADGDGARTIQSYDLQIVDLRTSSTQ